MNVARTIIAITAVVLATTAAILAADSHQAGVDRVFAGFNTHSPGCAVGVAKDGNVVLRAGYGMADLERNVAITPESVFESGSVAKQFTAAALLLAAQQGRISLDDPLRKYLTELPDFGTPVTIRHVLSHLSGLREWRLPAVYAGLAEGRLVYDNEDLLRMAARQKALNYDPGTRYSYTNTGFNISTILIERALKQEKTFQQFTEDNIFKPLGMAHSHWRDDYRAITPNRALAYARTADGNWRQDTPVENIIGAGGLLTTVDDLLRWNENFVHHKVGGEALVEAQQTRAVLKNGRTISYAAGLTVQTFDGLREVSHGGSTGGYRTWLGRYPDQHLSIAVLCNAANANPVNLAHETVRLWTGTSAAPKTVAPYPAADPAKMAALAGRYRNLSTSAIADLTWADGKLTGPGGALTPVSATEYSVGAGAAHLVVEEGTGRFRMITADEESVYEKVERAHPSKQDLEALAGIYTSEETQSKLTVSVGEKAEELSLRIGEGKADTLRPVYRDAFTGPHGIVRFLRDPEGRVTGLSASDGRTWDLRFTRTSAAAVPRR